jgi:hypothetical protein
MSERIISLLGFKILKEGFNVKLAQTLVETNRMTSF